MGELSPTQASWMPAWWKIWANPIFLKYRRLRLRPRPTAIWAIAIGLLATFIFTVIYLPATQREMLNPVEAARTTIIPLFILQGVLLMLFGTGAVASGIIQEKEEGTLDYQRLTPMHPMAKILGYLFGLPIREYLLVGLISPLMIFALIRGQIPLSASISIYLIFFSCVLLYHMTGMVAGMVMNRRKFAARFSQGMVIVFYLILPNFSNLGFYFFEYLTVRPVLVNQILPLLPQDLPSGLRDSVMLGVNDVPFFAFQLSPFVFSLLIQLLLLSTFFVVVYRKWENPVRHSMGKWFGLVFYSVVLVLILGNLLPLIEAQAEGSMRFGVLPREAIPIAVMLTMGMLCFSFSWLVISVITPNQFEYMTGLRRVLKLRLPRIPLSWDASSSLFHAVILAVLTLLSSLLVLHYLFEAGLMVSNGVEVSWAGIIRFPIILGLLTLTVFGMVEYWGNIRLMLFVLLGWGVPFFAAIILIATSNSFAKPAIYLGSISPLGCMVFTIVTAFEGLEDTEYLGSIQNAVLLCIVIYTLLPAYLILRLKRKQALMAEKVAQRAKGSVE